MVVLALEDGGYPATSWYLAALYLLALLGVVAVGSRGRLLRLSRAAMVAAAFLAAFTAWSYLSITWAGAKGDAWDGANRTFLYLIVFSLFAALPWRTVSGVAILALYVAATTVLGVFVFVRAGVVGNPQPYFIGSRFSSPTGYQNANAALFMAPVWPALFLAARREIATIRPRVMLASAAFPRRSGDPRPEPRLALCDACSCPLLRRRRSQTGSLTGRLGITGAATALAWPTLAEVYDANGAASLRSAMRDTWPTLAVICAVLFVTGVAFGLLDRRVRISKPASGGADGPSALPASRWRQYCCRWPSRAGARTEGSTARGINSRASTRTTPHRPTSRAASAAAATTSGASRSTEFKSRPIGGVGADNFAQGYLEKRETTEEPLYPHSVELRILAGAGIVGALLFLGFLGASLFAALSVWRSREHDSLAKGVVAAAIATFGYWWIHGSVDWFWEFPALGGAAFAWLGLATGVARSPAAAPAPQPRSRLVRRLTAVTGIAVAVFGIVSFVPPWISAREVAIATDTWRSDPNAAFDRLSRARKLNFLSDRPDLVAGAIASRVRDWPRMRASFEGALGRDPRNWYAYLELGVLDSIQGRKTQAVGLLARAHALDPLEETTTAAIERIENGRSLSFGELDRLFVERVRRRLQ